MLTLNKYEGKHLETLKNKISDIYKIDFEELYYSIKEEKVGLFKNKNYVIEVISKEEIKKYINEYINNIAKYMSISIKTDINFNENIIIVNLYSNNNNIIIGASGKNLEALKNVISQSIRELNKLNLRLEIDVNNYKERKLKIFKKEIEDICNSVINTKVEVKLDPMNSYKRRIVHSIVSNYKSLTSFSVLDEPNRYTIIKFKD